MRKKIYFSIVVFIVGIVMYSQENSIIFQNKEYVKVNNEWKLFNAQDSQYYPIESNVVTIKFKSNVNENEIQTFIQNNNLTFLRKAVTNWYDFQLDEEEDIFQKSNQFISTDSLIIGGLEIPVRGSYEAIPNDLQQDEQWHLDRINVYDAWDIETGDPSVIVAILDSGTDWTHEDLGFGTDSYQNIYLNVGEDSWTNANNPSTGNGIDDDGNGLIDDWKGWNFGLNNNNSKGGDIHGTLVAGVVGAKTNNNKGVAGVAGGWNNEGAKLLICKVGDYAPNSLTLDDAILYSAQMGAKVINMSLSIGEMQSVVDAIDYAYDNYGAIIVCASGSTPGSSNLNPVKFPASHPKAISVGATIQGDQRSNSSHGGENLFMAAPGSNMLSTQPNNLYGWVAGTSYAAPIVSGVIALMYSVNPNLSQEQVKDILRDTSEKVGGYDYNWNPANPGHSKELGYGLVNAYKAVLMAKCMADPTGLDLYIKDNPEDFGEEPNTTSNILWNSQDIWVRHTNDNELEHQNPEYDPNLPNYVYVKVRNRGCIASSENDTLKVYWSKAATAMSWESHWNGSHFNNDPNQPKRGDFIGQVNIPVIQPGGEAIIPVQWNNIPNPDDYVGINFEPWHFCLLARIESVDDPMDSTETTSTGTNVRNNNNIAQKNITIVDVNPDSGGRLGGVIAVGNPFNTTRNFTLNLVADNRETGNKIFEEAEVSVKLDNNLFDVWVNGGRQGNNIIQRDERTLVITGDNASLGNLVFRENEFATLYLKFNFLTQEVTQKEIFTYHVIQKETSTNEVIGGETYEIRKNPRVLFIADAGTDKQVDKNEPVTLSAEILNEPAVYNWYDNEGNLIYEGADFTTSVEIAKTYKLEIIALADGYKDYAEVEVTLKPNSITTLYPNPSSNQVTVAYKINEGEAAYLSVTGFYGSNISNNYILDIEENEVTLDVSSYPQGLYSIALIVNGEVQDTITLIKQ